MVLTCLCGGKFGTIEALYNHAIAKSHLLKCTSAHCGSLFASLISIQDHQAAKKHDGAIQELTLRSCHSGAADPPPNNQLKCTTCGPNSKAFKDSASLRMHVEDKHPAGETCAICGQTFRDKADCRAVDQRQAHQKGSRHCFCVEHNLTFTSIEEFSAHMGTILHATVFQCLDCGRKFTTQQGLDDHILACSAEEKEFSQEQSERAKAAFVAVEEANLRCEECERSFKNLTALRQHKDSVKHKPLAHFSCNVLPSKCNQTFTSYSAWFFHIESGKCKSGLDRKKLYAMVQNGDSNNLITYQINKSVTKSISGAGLCSNASATDSRITDLDMEFDRLSVSSFDPSGVMLTPDASSDASQVSSGGLLLLTPSTSTSRSRASSMDGILLTPSPSSNSRSEWSYITDSHKLTPSNSSRAGSSTDTITYENLQQVGKMWPCVSCPRTFKTKNRLIQHLNSPAHAPKLFHCPTPAALGMTVGKVGKEFKTLSGCAQHVEAGACDGGVDLLKNFINICQGQSKIATTQVSN